MNRIPKGIIMILHQGFTNIDPQGCINAMPKEWYGLDRKTIKVSYSDILDLGFSHDLNFAQYTLEHKRKYYEDILPIIEANKDYQIVYFGLVQIPLGIDFGHLFHNDKKIEIFQYHNEKKVWYQSLSDQTLLQENKLITPILPPIDQKGIAHAMVRLSISHQVKPKDTLDLLPNAAEVDCGFVNPKEAVINSREELLRIGKEVKEIFDSLSNNKSRLKVIHLFASIPCGVAFLIGTKIAPNIHPFIQTYQYKNTEIPKYSKAILVKKRVEDSRSINEVDRKIAEDLRDVADNELRQHIIERFCERNKEEANRRIWPLDLVLIEEGIMNEPFWSELPAISKTGIENDQCSEETNVENGFIRIDNIWHIDDRFFISLSRNNNITTDDNIRKAVRLFFFHEILHYVKHGMGDGKNENIGSFPKVLEMADYQADVYAILNEYGFQRMGTTRIDDSKGFFIETIEIAIETMWCFDNQGYDLTQIEIRRLSRYLIWYWQLIRIEKSDGSLNQIVKILEKKPIIELTGLKIVPQNNRLYFNLNSQQNNSLEIAVFYQNEVIRKGSSSNFKIEKLIDGVRKMNGNIILTELKRFYPTHGYNSSD